MIIGEVMERLERDLKIPVNRSQLHFYDKINLIEADRDGKESRIYNEQDYINIRMAVMLSYIGIDLQTIDRLINKQYDRSVMEILDKIRTSERFQRAIKSILKEEQEEA